MNYANKYKKFFNKDSEMYVDYFREKPLKLLTGDKEYGIIKITSGKGFLLKLYEDPDVVEDYLEVEKIERMAKFLDKNKQKYAFYSIYDGPGGLFIDILISNTYNNAEEKAKLYMTRNTRSDYSLQMFH